MIPSKQENKAASQNYINIFQIEMKNCDEILIRGTKLWPKKKRGTSVQIFFIIAVIMNMTTLYYKETTKASVVFWSIDDLLYKMLKIVPFYFCSVMDFLQVKILMSSIIWWWKHRYFATNQERRDKNHCRGHKLF